MSGPACVVALCDGRVAAQVAGRIGGPHPVPVRGRRRQPDVVERGAGRGRDLDKVGTSRTLAALDPVTGHADVVGRRRPRKVDLARRHHRRRQPGRHRRRLRIRRRLRGRALDARVAAQVAGQIGGPHPVPVRGRGRQTGVVEARPGRSPDLDEVGTSRTLTTLNPIPGHPHVVRRGRPGKVDLASRRQESPTAPPAPTAAACPAPPAWSRSARSSSRSGCRPDPPPAPDSCNSSPPPTPCR